MKPRPLVGVPRDLAPVRLMAGRPVRGVTGGLPRGVSITSVEAWTSGQEAYVWSAAQGAQAKVGAPAAQAEPRVDSSRRGGGLLPTCAGNRSDDGARSAQGPWPPLDSEAVHGLLLGFDVVPPWTTLRVDRFAHL